MLSFLAEVFEAGNVSWLFKNSSGAWVPYSSDENAALEEGFVSQAEVVDLQDGLRIVHLPSRLQKRLSSNSEREVRPPHFPS